MPQSTREQAGSDLKQITLSCAHATMLDTGLHRIQLQYKTTYSSIVAVEALQMDLVTCAAAASASFTTTNSSAARQQRPPLNVGMDFPSASNMGSSKARFAKSYSGRKKTMHLSIFDPLMVPRELYLCHAFCP